MISFKIIVAIVICSFVAFILGYLLDTVEFAEEFRNKEDSKPGTNQDQHQEKWSIIGIAQDSHQANLIVGFLEGQNIKAKTEKNFASGHYWDPTGGQFPILVRETDVREARNELLESPYKDNITD